jgi:hypothetical protein
LGYPGDWIPRSRGADDSQLVEAWNVLDARGFVTDGRINEAGLAYREYIENKTNELCEKAWRSLGAELTKKYCELIEPIGYKFLARIDATAGENWMPAARDSRRK